MTQHVRSLLVIGEGPQEKLLREKQMIGALAILTIGGVFIIAAFMFLRHNMDPKNLAATKAVAGGDSSAHTGVRGGSKPDHMT